MIISGEVWRYYLNSILYYQGFAILHELAHLVCAMSLGLVTPSNLCRDGLWKTFLLEAIFFRRVSVPYPEEPWKVELLKASGWFASAIIATILHFFHRNRAKGFTDKDPLYLFASYLVVLDAFATDVFGFQQLFMHGRAPAGSNVLTVFCGNFGAIILHRAWFEKGGNLIYDIIEKMIQITMMRGAQSGGVVAFRCKETKGDTADGHPTFDMHGSRTRVVKSKRGDLSKMLRAKMKNWSFPSLSKNPNYLDTIRERMFFAGHTRFATTSKATFDGTHPHQWSKPKTLKVYNMEKLKDNDLEDLSLGNAVKGTTIMKRLTKSGVREIANPTKTRVENFISHNGDFEYYSLNGETYEFETIQEWLEKALETPRPSSVDSAAIAGVIDIIRSKGSFLLSVRYVVCLGLPTSRIDADIDLPSHHEYDVIAKVFEDSLHELQTTSPYPLHIMAEDEGKRMDLARKCACNLTENTAISESLKKFVRNEETGAGLYNFAVAVVNAFFDNDLLQTVRIFMSNAKGSFGLCAMSSLDAHRQVCLAARGQTMSLAFYPRKQLILWGSEQAAVKAGLNMDSPEMFPSGNSLDTSVLNLKEDVLRLDLDDLGGEICLVDYAQDIYETSPVSVPNRDIKAESVMHNQARLYIISEEGHHHHKEGTLLYHRMTKLTKNRLITDLQPDSPDLIANDIRDTPGICASIQDDWLGVGNDSMFSLNRLTAWNLGRCLKSRLEKYANKEFHTCPNRVDILVTGCEVSLWLAEQFASDLQKSFPKLRIVAVSSNKLLGLYGQEEINIPTIGHSISEQSLDLDDAITIIVSHSGGTFSPLGCSSLFQSKTDSIFVVTSEWDTQIGKQLRSFDNNEGIGFQLVFNSRIFVTGCGMRPAEPCSVSVAATHQLLTNIFEFISVVILSDDRYKKVTGAVLSLKDLQILECCNRENIQALEDIVGYDVAGLKVFNDGGSTKESLCAAGNVWAQHILENVKAYIMTIVYIIGTVVSGYPLASGIAIGSGLAVDSKVFYFLRFLDALIYIFLPQINIIILRVLERRHLLHRMVGRTVVIADIPWVAQASEAFLSKIFACSYSIAGLTVFSANPSDHLVHRMTHRVVRGSLLICGRPDGRLSALTASEQATSLSINQASSIQSLGSTCESITIGHNPFKLPLTERAIVLKRFRPLFLCEYLLGYKDGDDLGLDVSVSLRKSQTRTNMALDDSLTRNKMIQAHENNLLDNTLKKGKVSFKDEENISEKPDRRRAALTKGKSSAALLGQYKSLEGTTVANMQNDHCIDDSSSFPLSQMIDVAIKEKKWNAAALRVFQMIDLDGNGMLSKEEFVNGLQSIECGMNREALLLVFEKFVKNDNGTLSIDDFFKIMKSNEIEIEEYTKPPIRDRRGLIQVLPDTRENFFGEKLVKKTRSGKRQIATGALKSQNFAQELYESRIASLQRFMAMCVMFHQMGSKVERFFRFISFGLLSYRIDRTHSIMRIATTASPVSGADVRDRKRAIFYMRKIHRSVETIENAWLGYKAKNVIEEKKE